MTGRKKHCRVIRINGIKRHTQQKKTMTCNTQCTTHPCNTILRLHYTTVHYTPQHTHTTHCINSMISFKWIFWILLSSVERKIHLMQFISIGRKKTFFSAIILRWTKKQFFWTNDEQSNRFTQLHKQFRPVPVWST